MKRASEGGAAPPVFADKSAKVTVTRVAYKACCLRRALGACVAPAWKAAINHDVERVGAIVWLGSRAFHHYLTTRVATGKATLPDDDNALARLVKACFTAQCADTHKTAARRAPAFVEWRAEW